MFTSLLIFDLQQTNLAPGLLCLVGYVTT